MELLQTGFQQTSFSWPRYVRNKIELLGFLAYLQLKHKIYDTPLYIFILVHICSLKIFSLIFLFSFFSLICHIVF